MSSAHEHLREWLAAGLIDEATARRIEAHERGALRRSSERPSLFEALIYLGVAVTGVGVAVLIGSRWEHLDSWARVAAPAIPALLAFVAGQRLRNDDRSDFRRGGRVAWLAACALGTATAGIAGREAGLKEEDALLVAAIVALLLGSVAWWFERSEPQVVGVAAASLLFGASLPSHVATDYEALTAGCAFALAGAVGILLAEVGFAVPLATTRALAGLGFAFGAYMAGVGPPTWPQALVFVAAGLLLGGGLMLGRFVYLGLGVAALFIGLTTVIGRNVHDPTLASLALVSIGVALVGTVMLLGKFQPWRRGGGGADFSPAG